MNSLTSVRASLVAQLVKNLPAMQENLVQFLGREYSLKKGQATHCSILGLPRWLTWSRIRLQCRRPLGWEDPLEKGQATHCSILGLPWWLSW